MTTAAGIYPRRLECPRTRAGASAAPGASALEGWEAGEVGVGREPPVDHERGARDRRRLVAGEKQGDVGDFVGTKQPPQGMPLRDLLSAARAHGQHQLE